jgi:chromosome segregation ATPase
VVRHNRGVKMSFINRNANLILLTLIVVSAIALTAATVFFQNNFEDVNSRYNTKLSELNQITDELIEYKAILDETKEEISLLRLRDEDFTEKFTDMKDTAISLEGEKSNLEKERSALKNDLQDTIEKYNDVKKDYTEAKVTISDLAEERAGLRAQVESLKSEVRQLEIKLEDAGIQ